MWLEGRGRDNNNFYRRIELWTGTLGRDLTLEGATLVTALPRTTMTTPTLGGGTAAIPLQDRGFLVVRPGEPGRRTFMPPADEEPRPQAFDLGEQAHAVGRLRATIGATY